MIGRPIGFILSAAQSALHLAGCSNPLCHVRYFEFYYAKPHEFWQALKTSPQMTLMKTDSR